MVQKTGRIDRFPLSVNTKIRTFVWSKWKLVIMYLFPRGRHFKSTLKHAEYYLQKSPVYLLTFFLFVWWLEWSVNGKKANISVGIDVFQIMFSNFLKWPSETHLVLKAFSELATLIPWWFSYVFFGLLNFHLNYASLSF